MWMIFVLNINHTKNSINTFLCWALNFQGACKDNIIQKKSFCLVNIYLLGYLCDAELQVYSQVTIICNFLHWWNLLKINKIT